MPRLVPGALVLRLFLTPDYLRRVRVAFHLRHKCLVWERMELLDADDGRALDIALAPLRHQIVVDLAAAADDAFHRIRVGVLDLANDGVKLALDELRQRDRKSTRLNSSHLGI